MRVIFMGTPEFAVPTLAALAEAGHEVACVYTQPPRPGGRRGKELTPSPVQCEAERRGIPVRYPVSLKGAAEQAEFAALDADVAVVAAYGLILPQAVLDAPRLGCLNVHGSLLPRWRGAAPVQRAILAGDAETGVGIMQMERGLDTGPVLLEERTAVDGKTAGALTDELAALGAGLMVRVLADLPAFPPVAQTETGVTYAHKIDKAEARIDWTRSAVEIERQVRAFNPAPGAFFELAGERCKVLAAEVIDAGMVDAGVSAPAVTPLRPFGAPPLAGEGLVAGTVLDDALTVACSEGAVRLVRLQRAGRPAMDAGDLLRGWSLPAGTVLG